MSKINEIEKLGLTNIGKVHYNLSYEELFDHEVKNGEGRVTSNGTFSVDTGIFTGRSPKDKYLCLKVDFSLLRKVHQRLLCSLCDSSYPMKYADLMELGQQNIYLLGYVL